MSDIANFATTLNLTQHLATADQAAAGVVNVPDELRVELEKWLTVPAADLLADDAGMRLMARAEALRALAGEAWGIISGGDPYAEDWCPTLAGTRVMIGGLPALQAPLAARLARAGFRPVFAVSDRVSAETTQPGGAVVKVSKFVHLGFVSATLCVNVDD